MTAVVIDFGNAIKDLAAANIFPGDMLLKNFGVTRHGRVVFYDYDEIVPLDRLPFQKHPPAPDIHWRKWRKSPGIRCKRTMSFPEEFSRFLGLAHKAPGVISEPRHADLMRTDFWIGLQEEIRHGVIRHVPPYHAPASDWARAPE